MIDEAPMPGDADVPWQLRLRRNEKSGALFASALNLALILRHHEGFDACLRYDERADVVEWCVAPPVAELARQKHPRALRDDDETHLRVALEELYQASFSTEIIHAALIAHARERTIDPVRTWLDSCVWDGTARIDNWLHRLLGAEDTELNRAIGAKWLISAVARVYEPGCQADHILVLEGPQGAGKSSALRALCADPKWYSSDLPDIANLKAAQEVLQGPWIVEIGELDAMRRAEISRVKAFITTRADRYRAAYAKNPESRPRRCVFAGTTNEDAYLHDATGGRRFWPVAVGRINVLAITKERGQLWAEAVHRYRQRETWYLDTAETVQAAARAQGDRYSPDPWEEQIGEHLHTVRTKAGANTARVTVAEVLQDLKVEVGKRGALDAKRVAQVLARLGWRRVQRRDGPNGTRLWAYELSPGTNVIPSGDARGDGASSGDISRPIGQLSLVTGKKLAVAGDAKSSMTPLMSPLVTRSPEESYISIDRGVNSPTGARTRETSDAGDGDEDPNAEWRD